MALYPSYKKRQLEDSGLAKSGLFGGLRQADEIPTAPVPMQEEMPKMAMADSVLPGEEGGMPNEAPHKPSLFSRIGDKVGGFFKAPEQEAPRPDEYGLTPPTQHKDSGFSKLLKIAIPSLLGAAGGVGLLPGAAMSYLGGKKAEAASEKDANKDYMNMRASLFKNKKLDDDLGVKKDTLQETIKHHRALEGLSNQRLNSSNPKESVEDKSNFDSAPLHIKSNLSKASAEDLILEMSNPDKRIASAARHVYRLKTKSHILEKTPEIGEED